MKLQIVIFAAAFSCSVSGQSTFQNLDFESADLSSSPNSVYVSATSALPGWNAYLGTTLQSEVYQNGYTTGSASIDIFGPNYQAAGQQAAANQGIIDGNYTVFLQAGLNANASIEQSGMIPTGTESLQFKAWDWSPSTSTLAVSFNGDTLSLVVIGSGLNYTLYGVDMTSYDGQTGALEFTSVFNYSGPSWIELDDIAFSTEAVPEPSPLALTGVGGLLFALWRRFAPKRP